jgi:hypothetical protein
MDVEASGFGPDSYPIEIAWSDESGEIQRNLINPKTIPHWTSWSTESEKIHGLERQRLERNGWNPEFVADRLIEDLQGKIVYTDAPEFDQQWVEQLFRAVNKPMPFHCEHIDELLLSTLRKPQDAIWEVVLRIEKLKANLAEVRTGKHAAGYDVGYLLQLWRHAHGDQVKMNHGVGPLPLTSTTGTFERLKKPAQ